MRLLHVVLVIACGAACAYASADRSNSQGGAPRAQGATRLAVQEGGSQNGGARGAINGGGNGRMMWGYDGALPLLIPSMLMPMTA